MDVSIIIVSYNTEELLNKCLSSILLWTTGISYEIIVIENYHISSEGHSFREKYPSIIWIYPGYNAGFGRANNLGINIAKGEYFLFLNPDTQLQSNLPKELFNFHQLNSMEFNLGALTCKIINQGDGSLLVGSGRGFQRMKEEWQKNPFFQIYKRIFGKNLERKYVATIEHNHNHTIDFFSGACFIIAKKMVVNEKLYFDEDFFLYYEDVELSNRIHKLGYQNYFLAETCVLHVNSGSTSKLTHLNFQILVSKWLYFRKTRKDWQYNIYQAFVIINLKINLYLVKRKKIEKNIDEIQLELKVAQFYMPKIANYTFRNTNKEGFLKFENNDLS